MIDFRNSLDARAFFQPTPAVARLTTRTGDILYIVIGTDYGYAHTTGGDVRKWRSRSGASKYAKEYRDGLRGL